MFVIPISRLVDPSHTNSVRYIPEWFPGASFKKQARIWRETIIQLPLVPFEAVKEAFAS